MRHNFKLLLTILAVAVLFAAMTVVAYAELTYPATGYVQMYESDKETAHTPVEGDLVWTIDKEGEEVVLTITGEAPTLTFNSKAAWNNWSGATVPWFNYLNAVTKVVIEAPITAIEQDCAFNKLANAHTVVLPETEIRLKGSMIFAGMKALKTLGPEGTEEYTLDLRTLYGGAAQPFDTTCLNVGDNTITVLMPYTLSCPMNTVKPFNNETKVLFKVLAGSSSDITVSTIKAHADDWDNYTTSNKNVTPHTKYVTVEYYDASDLGVISGGVEGKYQYNFDFATGALTILNKYPSGWRQFDTHGPEWQAFKKAWGQYVKTAVVDKFDKISFGSTGDTTPLFAGMANLETVMFQVGQRMQNGRAASLGWFEGCTSLKSISFGGELVDGVFDFSGMTFHKDDSYTSYLSNIFKGCESVKEVILPANEYLASVKATTFAGCTSLEKVTLMSSITEIEDGAFADCPNVVLVVEDGSYAHTWAQTNDIDFELYIAEEESNVIEGRFSTKNDLTYSFNKETKVLTIAGTGDVLEMDYVINWEGIVRKDTNGDGIVEVVAQLPWLGTFAADVKEVVIEAELVKVGNYMLSRFTNCEKITIPASLTSITQGALAYNKSLNTVVVAGNEAVQGVFDFTNIKDFGAYVFDGSLDNVTPTVNFSSKLAYFGVEKMAMNCKGLTFNLNGAEKAAVDFILGYELGTLQNVCQNLTVNYDKDFNPFEWEGYSVRLTDYNGLRSVFSVADNVLALYAAANGVTVKEYGTLVGTLDNFKNNPDSEKIIKTAIYADGEFVGKLLGEPSGKANFAITLVNIPEEHYETVFASLVYVVLVDEEGEETVEYFCQNSADIKTVATAMYEAGAFSTLR